MEKRINLFLTERQIEELDTVGRLSGLSRSEIIRRALDDYLRNFWQWEKERMSMNTNIPLDGKRHFVQIEKDVEDFQNVMNKLGLDIKEGSELDKICESTRELNDVKYRYNYDHSVDNREKWRRIVGLNDLFVNILKVRNHKDFLGLKHHFEYLNKGLPPQNTTNEDSDDPARKIFELHVATLVMSFADDVELETPDTKENNPDIIFTYKKKRIGIACKILQSENDRAYFKRIKSGIKQIEKANVERGFVVFNMKNLLPHDDLFPLDKHKTEQTRDIHYNAFVDVKVPIERVVYFCFNKMKELAQKYGTKLGDAFEGKKVSPMVLNFCPIFTSVAKNGDPIFTKLNILAAPSVQNSAIPLDEEIANKINNAAHNIAHY